MLSGSREQGTIGMHNNILGPSQSGGETNVRQRTQGCLVLRAIGVPGQRFQTIFFISEQSYLVMHCVKEDIKDSDVTI